MNKETDIKELQETIINRAQELIDIIKSARQDEPQPDLPDNTLPNAPLVANGVKVYYAGDNNIFDGRTTESTYRDTVHNFPKGQLVIDRNHGEDNHWLPWDGKDELPPHVKPDDVMSIKSKHKYHGANGYITSTAKRINWAIVIQYLWLERAE